MAIFPHFQAGLLGGAALLLAGCGVGPNYQNPGTDVPPAFKESSSVKTANGDRWKQASPNDSVIKGKWWEIYRDPKLNALEERISISNQNVLAYAARFREAVSALNAARATGYPQVSGSPNWNFARSSATNVLREGQIATVSSSKGAHQAFEFPIDVSYLFDIWGSVRRTVEANAANAQASFADLENARLSFQVQLAQSYFSMRALDAQKEVLQHNVEEFDKFLALTQNRYKAGVASRADVAQAQTQVETARVVLIDLDLPRAQYEHAIAVLTGVPPSELSLARAPLTATPPVVPSGVPSELLERRPDIAGAERRMAAANANIGVAVAAFYPSVTLSGSGGVQSFHVSELFSGPSLFWAVGPTIAQTIFDAGERHALAQQARASYDEQVANYRQTVLTGFQQVEDNLSSLRVLEKEARAQTIAVQAAQTSLNVTLIQYKAGTQSALDVINAQSAVLNNEVNAVNIQVRRMNANVALIGALGGGWDVEDIPVRAALPAMDKPPTVLKN